MIRWIPQGEKSLLDALRGHMAGRLAESAREVTGAGAVAIRSDGRQVVIDDPDLMVREYGAPGASADPWMMQALSSMRTDIGGRTE